MTMERTDPFLARAGLNAPKLPLTVTAKLVATEDISSLSGVQEIDGIDTEAGDRVLLTAQTTASENGIYVARDDAWTRVKFVCAGMLVMVTDGDDQAGTMWMQTEANPIAVGTDDQTWVPARGASGMRQFEIDTIFDEYLLATDGTYIARPPTLQNPATNENGDSCTYSDEQTRTADDGTDTEDQIVYPAYVEGGLIYAEISENGTGVMYDPGSGEVEAIWMDLNVDARGWVQAP